MAETFHGYIETTQDVLLVFEACRRGLLPRVSRRLQEKERKMIRSGSVFVFDERESGIKRWTDGLVWSPSRILGNFLIYRELDKRVPGDKKLSFSSSSSNDARQRSYSVDQSATTPLNITDRNRERRLVGSLSDSYRFRRDGLIKKTMSIIINGVHQHLISYYLPNDIIENKLRTPSSVPELASLEISPDLLVKQNFRIPPMVEPSFDQTDATTFNDDRRMHPFRSMSMGSLRTTNNNNNNNNLNQPQMMYTTNSLYTLMNNNNDKTSTTDTTTNNNNLTAYYNTNTTYNGFQPLPSPSSMTSSPNTPMLSPVRQSFSQPSRNYSISSTSSGSMRYTSRPSFDMSAAMDNRIHPHMIPPEMNKTDLTQDFSTSPHLGQLLNPVHPLKQEGSNSTFYPTHDTNTIQDGNYGYPSQNTHSTVIPMFRNGSMDMYDDTQNRPELGIEPLMLK